MPLDDASSQWLADLGADGAVRDSAQIRLYQLLVRAASAETHRRAQRQRLTGAEADDLAHQAAADAMLALLAKLPTFRGESKFTTWAYRFVVLEVSNKLGRHFWNRRPVLPLDDSDWDRIPALFTFSAEREAEWRELFEVFRHAVEHELTDRQRRVFKAIVLDGIPLDSLCVALDSNRNALYKTLYDARQKLRTALAAKGHLKEDR